METCFIKLLWSEKAELEKHPFFHNTVTTDLEIKKLPLQLILPPQW